eukprot:CAMPEP_0168777922 /NCGR_PEP_ID=MMETSP0725-20121227/6826_1 /TAXON_ID=265536 /ORGANISM="Amphiprora sp., Strain CCMP467" /LENGTH=283 /DNA_ID=CAMNT_0008827695 /DNA_START=57 /DNA_END=908 /DNA_ORIENTATION=-
MKLSTATLFISLACSASAFQTATTTPTRRTLLHSSEQPIVVAEEQQLQQDELYQERTQKVAEAAQAGKSRWGDAENAKALQVNTAMTTRETAGPLTVQSVTTPTVVSPSSLVTPIPEPEGPSFLSSSVSNPAWTQTAPLSEVWNKQSSWNRGTAGLAAPTKFPSGNQVSAVSDPAWAQKSAPLSEVWNKQSSWDTMSAGLPAAAGMTKAPSKLVSTATTDPQWAKDVSPETALGTVWNKQTSMGMLGVDPNDYKKFPAVAKQTSPLVGDWGTKPLSIVWYKAY